MTPAVAATVPVEQVERVLGRIAVEDRGHDTPCWIWMGWTNDDGYGFVRFEGRDQPAHRVVYRLLVGPIPDGHELDHLCRVRRCVRPTHVDATTHQVNQQRAAIARAAARQAQAVAA